MNIDTIKQRTSHAKALTKQLRDSDQLPFTDVLSRANIDFHLSKVEYRNRLFTPDLTIFAFLSQAMSADKSCQAAVAQVIAFLLKKGSSNLPSANTAAYCKARARLPVTVLSGLAKTTGQKLEEGAPKEWLWRNRHVKLIDGSTLSMQDTVANQESYPQPSTQKKG